MSYLRTIELALNNVTGRYAHSKVSVVVANILRDEQMPSSQKQILKAYSAELKKCQYLDWYDKVDYGNLHVFIRLANEIYNYIEDELQLE